MCNEYSRYIALGIFPSEAGRLKLPPFEWHNNQIPNDLAPRDSVRIRDTAPIVRLEDNKLTGSMTTWAWAAKGGRPVFNFVTEGRDFSSSDRVLILATSFYEYTTPEKAKIKLKDKHRFTMIGEPWFWIAGIVKENCFTMLTTAPGEDVRPYHDRQIVTFGPIDGLDWLRLSKPQEQLFAQTPSQTFKVEILRKDGEER